jgi:pyruvate dehydrogenase E2 component (dihydrolipoamide acetyltransferase)
MATPIRMPRIGHAMTEGTVVAWLISAGGPVRAGETVLTIETDKAEYEVEAGADGTLSSPLVQVNDAAPVGAVLAYILAPGEQVAPEPETARSGPSLERTAAGRPPDERTVPGRAKASPRARRLAAERGVDLDALQGSGPGGLIIEADIERAAAGATGSAATEWHGRAVSERRRLGPVQRTTARRMQEAWAVPHIVQMIDADVTRAQQMRAEWRRAGAELAAVTFNDVVVKAAALAVAEHPELNAALDGDDLVLFAEINVGIAVDTPRGLVVPVIRCVDRRGLADIAAEARRLADKARNTGLEAADLQGGSLSVSNLGPYGIRAGTPVLNAPEAVLVFVGAVEERPVVRDGAVVVRSMVTLSIAYDHRVTDGAAAARLTGRIKTLLEDPAVLVAS